MIELASDDGLILHLWHYWFATGTARAGICIGLSSFFMMFKEEKTEKSHFILIKVSLIEMKVQYFRQV